MKNTLLLMLFASIVCVSCGSEPNNNNQKQPEAQTINWAAAADSCTTVLIDRFMNKTTGTFWATPADVSHNSGNIYWQQAHAMDVVVYAYERIRNTKPAVAETYKNYFRLWFENKANNYHRSASDPTGFLNPFTDDMCWICLTLIHMSEATGDDIYINTAKTVYDNYIITRAWTDTKGTGLPWKDNDKDRNACTNAPGCLVAAKLYLKYDEDKYLKDAQKLYDYVATNLLQSDGRVEEPPLTYTQGTFGEACRQLYHITQERQYSRQAELVINYALTSDRCTSNGVLRDEGHSMDQSIFKAVLMPYVANLILDELTAVATKNRLELLLKNNAEMLWKNLDRTQYPAMYCNYYWGSKFPSGEIASMGAQTSGASLMEAMVRIQ